MIFDSWKSWERGAPELAVELVSNPESKRHFELRSLGKGYVAAADGAPDSAFGSPRRRRGLGLRLRRMREAAPARGKRARQAHAARGRAPGLGVVAEGQEWVVRETQAA